jgi:hypothetical protein
MAPLSASTYHGVHAGDQHQRAMDPHPRVREDDPGDFTFSLSPTQPETLRMGHQKPISYVLNAVTIDRVTESTEGSGERDRLQSLPLVNYATAIAKAIEWLGDRYLLAKPMELVHDRHSKVESRNDPPPNRHL